MCLVSSEVVYSDMGAVVFYFSFRSIYSPPSLALLFRGCYHVECSDFCTSAFEPAFHALFAVWGKGIIFPFYCHYLVITDIIVRLIDTSTEPGAPFDLSLDSLRVIVFC